MRALAEFSHGEGKRIQQVLRKRLGRFQFSFDKYAMAQGENFATLMLNDPEAAARVRAALEHVDNGTGPGVRSLRALADQLKTIAEANSIEPEHATAIAELAGESEDMADETILSGRGLSLSPVVRTAIMRVLRQRVSEEGLSQDDKRILDEVAASLVDVEELLTQLMAGFYSGDRSVLKKYLYVSWLLWAFMRVKSCAVPDDKPRGFYDVLDSLSGVGGVVNFNYTDFGRLVDTRVIRFHGDCTAYIRQDRGRWISTDDRVEKCTDVESIASFLSELDIDVEKRRLFLPAIVPPCEMKPVIHKTFIERWADASKTMEKADLLVVVGYAFGPGDSHFNELFQSAAIESRVVVINPSAMGLVGHVCRLLDIQEDSLTKIEVNGFVVKGSPRIRFVGAVAEEINEDLLRTLEREW